MRHELSKEGVLTIWPEPIDLTDLKIERAEEDGGEVEIQTGNMSDEVMEILRGGKAKDVKINLSLMQMNDEKVYKSNFGFKVTPEGKSELYTDDPKLRKEFESGKKD